MRLAYDLYKPVSATKDPHPVILLHCIAETKATWIHLGPEIAERTGRKVYAVDMRNHGASPSSEEYNTDVLTEDVNQFLIEHQIPKAVIVGHSLGGIVAMHLALKQPEKVEKLVIEDVSFRKPSRRRENLVTVAVEMLKGISENVAQCPDLESARQSFVEQFKSLGPMLNFPDHIMEKYDLNALPFKWNGKSLVPHLNLDAICDALLQNKLLTEASGVYEGDILVIIGGLSKFTSRRDLVLAKHFPRATKVVVEDAGHFVHHSFPDIFLEEACNFINSTGNIRSKY